MEDCEISDGKQVNSDVHWHIVRIAEERGEDVISELHEVVGVRLQFSRAVEPRGIDFERVRRLVHKIVEERREDALEKWPAVK